MLDNQKTYELSSLFKRFCDWKSLGFDPSAGTWVTRYYGVSREHQELHKMHYEPRFLFYKAGFAHRLEAMSNFVFVSYTPPYLYEFVIDNYYKIASVSEIIHDYL